MSKKTIYTFLLILGIAFWGVSFGLVKDGTKNLTPFTFVFYRYLIASLVLAAIFYKEMKLISWQTVKIGMAIGIPYLAGIIMQTIGLKETTISNAAFLTGFSVLLLPIIKMVLYKRKVEFKIWIACTLATIGLYIIAIKDSFVINRGDVWSIACAVCFSFYILNVGRYSTEKSVMPSIMVTMWICTIGGLICSVLDESSVWIPNTNQFWIGVLFAALPATAYTYSISNIAQRYIGDEKTALLYLFEPIFATITGVILLQEPFTLMTLLGGFLIIFAMFISEYQGLRMRKFLF